MPRTLAILLSVLLAAQVGAGCGGQSAVTRTVPQRTGTGASGTAAKSTTVAKTPAVPGTAAAAAHAVNVRSTDVPGMVASGSSIEPYPRRRGGFGVRLARCAGGSGRSEEVASLRSASFTRSRGRAQTTATRVLRSVVHLMRTSSAASGDIAALRSPRAASCLAELRKEGSRSHLAAAVLRDPLPGVAAYAIRTTQRSPVSARVYIDHLGFSRGRLEVELSAVSSARPFPSASENRVLALLYARAKAQRR